jgi:3-oxoacyl-[acyl-carrier-protein] synthase II
VTIVVTGVGAVTALGRSARETFDRIVEGERGFRELTLFDPGEVRSRIVAEISDEEIALPADPSASRTSELALRAAREAMAEAKLDPHARRVGIVLGVTTAGMFETESFLAALLSTERSDSSRDAADHRRREEALSRMLSHPLSAPTDRLVKELGPFARARSMSSACSSGAQALAVAATWLELGLVDAVLCGAADSLCRVIVSGFSALGALDPEGARPFDVRRRGLTLGEGAGMLVLERAEEPSARERAICTLLGWASRSEAHHITNPEATGEAPLAAMLAALRRGGLGPRDIDYVNAHGTGTPLNDPMEARALARLFGDDLGRVPVSGQKGMIGHTLAAAGAIEAVITALAIDRGVVPPTGGLSEPDPECRLRHVMTSEHRSIGVALSSSFGFGGMDSALVFGRRDRVAPPSRKRRDVVVTGMCTVTPDSVLVGTDVADLPARRPASATVSIPDGALDPERARRLDRASRIGAIACGGALGASVSAGGVDGTGVVLGIAFGAVDATAEFMRRLRDKGPRMVRPAEFPSLVPSSPAGYVSIYHGLTGPAFVVADLAVSGECAIAQACELIAAGDVDRMCAGAVEERSAIVEEVLSVVFERAARGSPSALGGRATSARREGGAAVALASADVATVALARLGEVVSFSARAVVAADADALAHLPPPPDGAIVVLGTDHAAALVLASSWSGCPRIVCADACGAHEAAGSVAIAVAAAKVARGDAAAALFVGSAGGWGYAGTVWPPDRASDARDDSPR